MKQTKKVKILFFTILLICTALYAGEMRYINYDDLQNFDAYEGEVIFTYNHQNQFESYVLEDSWDYPYTRAECVGVVKNLYNLLVENAEPENQEYWLLKGIVASYLYNLDEMEYFVEAENAFKAVQALPSYDYRCLWFLANHYMDSALVIKSVELFQNIFEVIPAENLQPDIFIDYGLAAYLARMPMTAKYAYDLYEKYTGISMQNDSVYKTVMEIAHDFDGTNFDKQMIIQSDSRNGIDGLLIRPFGLWYSFQNDWDVTALDFPENNHFFMAQSQLITKNNQDIGYSVLMISSLAENLEQSAAYIQFARMFDMYDECTEVDLFPDRNDIIIFEYKDSDQYAEIGGAHGYFVLVLKPWTETLDSDIEIPQFMMEHDGEVHYYMLTDFYKRYPGDIVHFLLLDSCDYIFEESKEDFLNFLDLCQFY